MYQFPLFYRFVVFFCHVKNLCKKIFSYLFPFFGLYSLFKFGSMLDPSFVSLDGGPPHHREKA